MNALTMNAQTPGRRLRLCSLIAALLVWPFASNAQVAVAEIERVDNLQLVSASELETLVGPIALYPDDLLAIVLPASTFPLQIVEAQRFLQALEDDPSLEPDADWDDSVVALLNYPEVVDLLNEDLDWAWRLGEAVAAQQEDVITAIETFRDRAYAAGNLKSDDYQLVAQEGDTIQITPVQEDVIYVPYYEPAQVVVYQRRPVYYYYPRAYPVYYYPYPEYHPFHSSFFWGVTTAYAIGWNSHHLSVFHHSYYGHPYYGHSYWDRGWYRRPNIHVHNTVYVNRNVNRSNDRQRNGDRWQSTERRTVRASDQRVTRTRYYPGSTRQSTGGSIAPASSSRPATGLASNRVRRDTVPEKRQDIQFRDRGMAPAAVATRPSNQPRVQSTRQPQQKTTQSRPLQPKATQSRPLQPKATQSRPVQPKVTQSRPLQPQASFARPVQPKSSVARPSQPTQRFSRQSQPRQSVSRPSQPRQSAPKAAPQRQSAPKQKASSSSQSSRSASRRSGRDR